ncbi:Bax inhibitor 1 [Sparassis crispa]|uniref:Bax inhibitor 1 n=1 Tax=Sparassis crispa TaxID=139825 RepID=A0A401GEW0_9APHY|nr:Bax inhibitor 1 [Sparassis crispa]GBE80716.1 Bax inhibitor 1 [Sparassis crispa]
MSTNNYTTAPPAYQGAFAAQKLSTVRAEDDATEPLLGSPRSAQAGPSSGPGAIYNQPAFGDVPDDFKYGTSVSESSLEIRNAFVRKVYTILFCQILATCIVGGAVSHSPNAVIWVQTHTWAFYVPLIGTFINLGVLYWKRHSHPLNLALLSLFTLFEAFTLGVTVAFFDNVIVLQALLITLGVFLGLTLFTFQSKYDFSGMGSWLFAGLIAMVMTGFVSIFLPFGRTTDLIFAAGGCLLFSGYVVYDTYIITKRLSPDEYILAAISLYLDFINLFINILRLLNDSQDR